jgi:hypothetical protein
VTKITRVTIRETEIEYKGRKLIVQMLPRYVAIWPKGTKAPDSEVRVPWDVAYELGLKAQARRKP